MLGVDPDCGGVDGPGTKRGHPLQRCEELMVVVHCAHWCTMPL